MDSPKNNDGWSAKLAVRARFAKCTGSGNRAGRGPSEIAAELQISVKTVESHRENIKDKLSLDSGEALLHAAMRWRDGYSLQDAESAPWLDAITR